MSSKSLKYSALLAACIGVAALAGCGSSNKSGSASLDNVARVDETACAQCHTGAVEQLTGDDIYENYLASKHNLNFVGCQDCHGGGSLHNGVGPIPYAKPGSDQCAACHEETVEAFVASSHGPTDFTLEAAVDEDHRKCSRCHTHQGAVLSNASGYTGDKDFLAANPGIAPGILSEELSEGMKCVTCHVTHKTDALRAVNTFVGGAVVPWQPSTTVGATEASTNDQFNLCTSCHNYTKPDGTIFGSGTVASGTAPYYHNTVWYRILGTTHYDNPATPAVIEGYALRTNGPNNSDPCFDCHGHESKTGTRPGRPASIHTDWAKSAHGGTILSTKITAAAGQTDRTVEEVDAVMAAGATDSDAPGWIHYDWDSAGRASCQRCHTATGAANYMNNPTGYVSSNNNFAHLQAGQNEVMYCWGCHSNAGTGELRNPGAITENYAAVINAGTGTTGTAVSVTYPDIAGSNVCMTCHLGREVGDNIKTITDADGVLGFVNSHYLSAGGQLFGTTGYEYDGVSYANPSYFAHDKIGSAAAAGTGSNGPCAGCHMTTPNSHSFSNVTKDNAGAITALTSTACVTCHDGTHGTALTAGSAAAATFLETEKEHYHAALDALDAALQAKGIYFFNAHPYFYQAANGAGGAYTNWAGPYGFANWKNVMGAAFNYNLLHHDPGGYAHNRIYSKRLIFDAIDFIDNGVLDGVITVTGDAATYLDGNAATAGVQRP